MLQLLQNKNFPYLSCNSYFIEICGYRIIIDTGNYFLRSELLKNLGNNNIRTDKINYVINTHLHFDHCGNNEIFPNARFILPENELNFIDEISWFDRNASLNYVKDIYPLIPEDKLKNFLRMIHSHKKSYDWILENLERVLIINEDTELFPGVSLVFSLGHSPGHISLLYQKEKICFSGDIIIDGYNGNPEDMSFSYIVKDHDQLMESRTNLINLAETFYPGHGECIHKWNHNVVRNIKYKENRHLVKL